MIDTLSGSEALRKLSFFINKRWDNGSKSGHGVLTYSSGARYEGLWARDRANGRGVMFYANNDKYDGEVK